METNVGSGVSIEVVQSWKGQALDTELVSLDRPRRIAVGEAGRFLLSLGESFDVVVVDENGRATVHVPARATALVFEGESSREIGADDADRAFVIGASTTVELTIADMTFFVRQVQKETEKFKAPIVDATGWRWMAAALAFHVAILATFFFVPPDASALSSDLTGEQMRYIQVHLDAVEPTPPPPAPVSGGDSSPEGTSSPPAPSDTTGPVSDRPAVAGGPNRPARTPRTIIAPTADTVREFGTFEQLSRAFASLEGDPSPYESGNLADGAFGPGTALVPGGLDGEGPGGLRMPTPGHGTCTHEPCGVGTIDQDGFDTHGGPGVGPGPDFTPHAPVEHSPQIHGCRPGDADCRTIGGLTREQIRSVIARHRPEVRFCYEQALISRPDLEGRVTAGFQIQQDGHVSQSSASGIAGVDTCVAQAVRRWQFPTSSSPTVVSYPFVMESSSGQ